MGAHFDSICIRATTEDDLKKKYKTYIEQEEHEHGHDAYSGTLATTSGLSIRSHTKFKDRHKADKFIEENAEKWEEAIAVRITKKPYKDAKIGHWWVIGGWCAS